MLQSRKLQRDSSKEVHSHLAPDGGMENVAYIPIFCELCTFCCYRTDLSLLAAHTHQCYLLNKPAFADLLKCSWQSDR